ncbi:Maestro heat-like repeat-containing protein family member 1 [Trichoplax sp. H2]|nr:Maestro heat-like repeat-containing protein family member 1 [Trichoplax sp. H2]|eukprot:RDD47071.1 Maestro heat-like repeat-containing protein family member 1 [Trichoplax sp. H2]
MSASGKQWLSEYGSEYSTGGQIDEMVLALIESCADKSESVRATVADSLTSIGKKKPALVLNFCKVFLEKRTKLDKGHRVLLLGVIKRIVTETIDTLPSQVGCDLVRLASSEMTASKEVIVDWQTAASEVLVALGSRFAKEVITSLLDKFGAGAIPHYFVVQTLANLASKNAYCVVPHLKDTFGRLLPMLGMAKSDNMKYIFSYALNRFCESISEYVANIDKAPDKKISSGMYFGEVSAGYDVLFGVWLQSKDSRLRSVVAEAIGQMALILPRDKIEEQSTKLISVIVSLYRKHSPNDHLLITECLCNVLAAHLQVGCQIADSLADNVMATLHNQACAFADFGSTSSIKNHNEVLRCFAVIGPITSNRLIQFLLNKLENPNDKIRIGTLNILKHIINASGIPQDKMALIISGLKILLNETNNKVKQTLAQVISAMAHHEYLHLEGGQLLVEFIVRQCALTDNLQKTTKPDSEVSNAFLRVMCGNVLQLVTTTVAHMQNVLWPTLIEFIVPMKYNNAAGVICRSAAFLANKKQSEESSDYYLDYACQVNLPKPVALLARLLVLAGLPKRSYGQGLHVLNFLLAMSSNINEAFADMWDSVLPRMITYLEEHSAGDDWNQKAWEDLVLKLLTKSLEEVEDENWTCELGSEMSSQIVMYENFPEEKASKNFLYKCIGVILRKTTNKAYVEKQLNIMFSSVNHTNQTEREGCAMGMGFASYAHLDAVLQKLEDVPKREMVRKSTGFMGFMKDKSEADVERIKSTLILSYGYVTYYSPVNLITSRIEVNILRVINPQFGNVKDSTVKQNLIRSVALIGHALHKDHLKFSFTFNKRDDLITHMLNYIKAEHGTAISTETRSLAMDACTTLIKLEPNLDESLIGTLVKICAKSIYCVNTLDNAEELAEKTLRSFNLMLCEILENGSPSNDFFMLYKHLENWIYSSHERERDRSLQSLAAILEWYLEHAESENKDGSSKKFGAVIARLAPRVADPLASVRESTITCTQLIFRIEMQFQAIGNDELVDAMDLLIERCRKEESTVITSVVNDYGKILAKKIREVELVEFIYLLLDGLVDCQLQSAVGTSAIINAVLRSRAGGLREEVPKLIQKLREKLEEIDDDKCIKGVRKSFRVLASYHLLPVLDVLLNFKLPYDRYVVGLWKTLAEEEEMLGSVCSHFMDLLKKSFPFQEQGRKEIIKIATEQPIAIACGFNELFKVPTAVSIAKRDYPQLFSTLLLRIGTCIKVQQVKEKSSKAHGVSPMRTAISAFQGFLTLSEEFEVLDEIDKEDGWDKIRHDKAYSDAIVAITSALCKSILLRPHIAKVIAYLMPALNGPYDNQRLIVAAFFAEIINQRCLGELGQADIIINCLLSRLVDDNLKVRMFCVRGLGNVASVGREHFNAYSTTVLSALMSGIDEKDDSDCDITLEAMSGLSRIIAELDETHVRSILINISLKIRPCFEKSEEKVRARAFTLFGHLSKFGGGPSKVPFLEQIQANMVSLLLHLNENEASVVKACKFTLRSIGPLLNNSEIDYMFQKYLLDDATLYYGEFLNNLTRLLISEYKEKTSLYVTGATRFFKSEWEEIRANAATLIGYYLGNLPNELRETISKEHVCNALKMLLKDTSPMVRSGCATATSLLYEY